MPSAAAPAPFWRAKTLEAMTRAEWESLCDGCGRCCLHKLRDDETDALAFTAVACRLLNLATCRCADYENRRKWVPDCVKLTPRRVAAADWLPPTCAYRLLAEGKDLPWWHPLVSGDPETVHRAGVSARGRAVRERDAGAFEDHLVAWPKRWPTRTAGPPPGPLRRPGSPAGARTPGAGPRTVVRRVPATAAAAARGRPTDRNGRR
ncbi:hypothetical protein GCM10010964_02260 [Caldovatus sediminis]|uniref:UPF0260 protein GCM10010964_02260 n=1 Tax=Caldovatus sediminis TaxID=2041189 RepID=A0A8J2Z7N5_9PROT|nr:hypothetical protein GCM10010964_02260 [Caldovatus sediminis]